MTHTFHISYLPCQKCHAKVHCDQCEAQLEAALLQLQHVEMVSVKITAGQVQLDGNLDRDAAEEALEDLGVFAD